MFELIAVGPSPNQRWRRILPPSTVIRLGRAPRDGWEVPWDMRISREHADILVEGNGLRVKCLRSARNSIYVRGEPSVDFTLLPGESFRIGLTTFHLESTRIEPASPEADPEHLRLDEALEEMAKQSSKDRLEALLSQLDMDTSAEAASSGELGLGADDLHQYDTPVVPEEITPFAFDPDGPAAAEDEKSIAAEMGLPVYENQPESEQAAGFIDGAAFGNYVLVDQIFRGGTGQVLKARHRYLDRMAAIKLLSMKAAEDPETLARFRRKMRLHSYFDHPCLVGSYDAGELDGMHYLIMEYVDGVDMVRILRSGPIKVRVAVDCILRACEALQFAHALGIVHRNINPSHLLVGRQGDVKLIGWGLAKCDDEQSMAAFEGPGKVLGVVDYVAPEQLADSSQVDHRADIYSLGCTLFAILVRRVVYPVDWPRRKAIAQRYQPPPSLCDFRQDAPKVLDEVFQRMMAKAPADRYQSVDEVIQALRNAV